MEFLMPLGQRQESEDVDRNFEEESEQLYEVEKVLGKRQDGGELKYLIKWVGFSEDDNTWEPVCNLEGVLHLINDFQENLRQYFNASPVKEPENQANYKQINKSSNGKSAVNKNSPEKKGGKEINQLKEKSLVKTEFRDVEKVQNNLTEVVQIDEIEFDTDSKSSRNQQLSSSVAAPDAKTQDIQNPSITKINYNSPPQIEQDVNLENNKTPTKKMDLECFSQQLDSNKRTFTESSFLNNSSTFQNNQQKIKLENLIKETEILKNNVLENREKTQAKYNNLKQIQLQQEDAIMEEFKDCGPIEKIEKKLKTSKNQDDQDQKHNILNESLPKLQTTVSNNEFYGQTELVTQNFNHINRLIQPQKLVLSIPQFYFPSLIYDQENIVQIKNLITDKMIMNQQQIQTQQIAGKPLDKEGVLLEITWEKGQSSFVHFDQVQQQNPGLLCDFLLLQLMKNENASKPILM